MRNGQKSRVSRALLTGSTCGFLRCNYAALELADDWAKVLIDARGWEDSVPRSKNETIDILALGSSVVWSRSCT